MKSLTAVLALPLLVLTGCPRESGPALTLGEATQALEQASDAGQAEGLTASSVDISTNFTIGKAVQEGAQELGRFIGGQLPCADVTLDGASLTVVYGARPGNCSYRGHAFSGTHVVSVERNQDAQVEVHHEWIDFSNGVVSLDGTQRQWNCRQDRGVSKLPWTNMASGRHRYGEGDSGSRLVAAERGIQVDGERSWEGDRGRWDLAIDGVQMRWTDPVPQAGSYTLSTPFDKTVSMAFARVDADTIKVTVAGQKREFSFDVSRLGAIVETK